MINQNTPDYEATALQNFLGESSGASYANVPGITEVRAQTEALLKKIASPVRLMIAGEFSSGKSTMTNLLVGEQLIPTGVLASPLPPVVFRFGTTLTSSACWWDGREPKAYRGADFDALMSLDPDYIVLTAANPILKHVTIFDTPGTSDPDREGEVLVELSGRAEMIIWCTNAVQAWRESERHTWFELSPNVIQNGILAVTHVDLPSVRQGFDRIMGRLNKEAGEHFKTILPIDTPSAIDVAAKGIVTDPKVWTSSGGERLVQAILDLASEIRQPDLAAARDLLTKHIAPIQDMAAMAKPEKPVVPSSSASGGFGKPAATAAKPGFGMVKPATKPSQPASLVSTPKPEPEAKPEPAPAPVVAAPAPTAAPIPTPAAAKVKEQVRIDSDIAVAEAPAPAAPKSARKALKLVPKPFEIAPTAPLHPLYVDWQSKLDALLTLIKSNESDLEGSGFLQAASDTVMELLESVQNADLMTPKTEWLNGQFQEALDTIVLMQMESGEGPIEDACVLLVQLSRDLAIVTQG